MKKEQIVVKLKTTMKKTILPICMAVLVTGTGYANNVLLSNGKALTTVNNFTISKIKSVKKTNVVITGKVSNDNGEALPGVTVSVKGTTTGTVTDADGKYTLNVTTDNATLVFSFIGYMSEEFVLGNQTSLDIVLSQSLEALMEVVVVGYGTQKKVSVTNSVSQIQPEALTKRPVQNLQQALQGVAPGLTVIDNGGIPGPSNASSPRPNTTLRVRGITSLPDPNVPTKNDILIIVDGIEQSISDINPNDVASISVLKDAASTAIYGSRAANGVILVTTKRGQAGKITVNYNGYYASQRSVNEPEMMDVESYMKLQQVAFKNAGLAVPSTYTDESIALWVNATDREKYPLPNVWYKELFKPAPQFSNNISVSGGNDFVTARMSARYMKQDALIDNYGSKLGELRLNTDFKISKRINAGLDLNYRRNNSTAPSQENTVYDRLFHGTLFTVPKYSDGTYGLSAQGHNPLMYAELGGVATQNQETFVGMLKADISIIDGLKFSTQFAPRIDIYRKKDFANSYVNTDVSNNRIKNVPNSSLTETRNNFNEYTLNNLLTYNKSFDKHTFSILGGYSEIANVTNNLTAYRERFYNNDLQSIGQGANDGTKSNSGSDSEWGLRSFLGRVNYDYADKYLLEVNGRYDGSSKFTGNNQYSFFPSFSAGWRLSQEEFMKDILLINELKVRGSWGQTGNQAVPNYSFYQSLSPTSYSFGGTSVLAFRRNTLANKDITWETTTQINFGVDARLFKGLSFSVDYYNKQTEGILISLPIPATVGLVAPLQNAGVVENKGVEIDLGYKGNVTTDISFGIGGNLAINKNKVIDLKGAGPIIVGAGTLTPSDIDPRYVIKEGLPLFSHWGYETDGYFKDQEDINGYPTYAAKASTKPGDVKYIDRDKNGVINADDMTEIGKSFPTYTFGINGNISYKGITLSFLFQGAADVDTRLSGALGEFGNNEGFVTQIVAGNYWTEDNTNARFPRPVKRDLRNINTSDRMIVDGSYLRLKNVVLSYNLPTSFIEKLALTNANVYVSGTNLLTFSKLKEWGLDPEVGSGRALYYPQTSLFTLGVNLQF